MRQEIRWFDLTTQLNQLKSWTFIPYYNDNKKFSGPFIKYLMTKIIKILLYTYKVLSGLAISKGPIKVSQPIQTVHLKDTYNTIVKPHVCTKTYSHRHFDTATTLWNDLPMDLIKILNLNFFGKLIWTFYKSIFFLYFFLQFMGYWS